LATLEYLSTRAVPGHASVKQREGQGVQGQSPWSEGQGLAPETESFSAWASVGDSTYANFSVISGQGKERILVNFTTRTFSGQRRLLPAPAQTPWYALV